MSTKQLRIILLTLVLAVIFFCSYIYLQKHKGEQKDSQQMSITDGQADRLSSTTEAKIKAIEAETANKIGAIEQKGENGFGGLTKEAQSQIEQAVNGEIQQKIDSDLVASSSLEKSRQEADRIEDELNKAILQKLNKK